MRPSIETTENLAPGSTQSRAKLSLEAARCARLASLEYRAEHGDNKAMTELRQTVANETNWVQRYRGPAEQTRHVLLDATLGSNLLAREAWERRAQMLQSELAGTHPTALERSICESIATCWLDMNLAAFTVAAKAKGGLTQGQQDFYQRRHDRAHARYLAAVQALARVRRLLAPTVAQLNIAQPGAQQLNLSASDRVVLPPRRAPDTITGEGAEGTGRHQ